MPLTLYDISVLSFQQTLEGVDGFLAKGLAWCEETGTDPDAIVETRLSPDMLPFRFQIQNVVFHSTGAMAAVQAGVLRHPGERPRPDYAGLQALIAEARETLAALTPEAINAHEGTDMLFDTPGNRRLFTAEDFILTFSLPNVHFHAATAYGILRHLGVPVGKRDFMGSLRLKAKLED